ncbi:sugar phosphate isomerase [Intrasporangium oryzae NRRL B-24470]|uniref:3-dehydroshikimate dehydratase n=1 Tax=Intrasporangium oryzae NRRL B-24470 TaxID=1386089 RepID=W9G9H2_9MICO|nr:sugar phosphate isomerase/epimerase and 4-hydroxyphenylpyruvate domain-containing protein [Intrasporangium oryzae]EWT02705.1 sugar phosphate isomerase [Intrasporangium oryzae NRRL B-24470]
MRKGIATVSISGTLAAKLEAIAAAHFDSVELFDADVVASPCRPEDIARRCAELGLAIDLFQPLRDVVGLTPEVFPDRLRFARAKFELMERLGATRALLCSAVHPASVDDSQLTAEQLGIVGDVAAEHGFTLAYEALAWGTHVNRFHQTRAIVDLVDLPNVGVAVDTFHMLARGDGAEALAGLDGDRIAFVQIADAHRLSMDVLEWSRHHRCFPGQGALDVESVVGAAVEAGYRGPLSLEVFSDIVREANPRDTARDAMRSLLHLEEQLRRRWEQPSDGRTLAEGVDRPGRPRVELFDPPPAPQLPGVGHVEIAVTPGDPSMLQLFSRLGFTAVSPQGPDTDGIGRAARTVLRNGEATVVLDARSDLELRRSAAGQRPHVAAVAVDGDTDSALCARAHAFNLPVSETREPEGRVDATRSPAGVEVRLGSPCPRMDVPAPGRWGPLDHLGIAVDTDRSDAEVSFHRTLIGLRPGPVSEFIDPAGRLRSRVLEPEAGALRVVLNIAVHGAGHPTWIGVNQLAYACTDLLRQAESLAASGAPVLPVPDSYYDDLAARLDPPPELLARLRRLNVLYDRDERGGELLHLYTPLVGGRFYIELLERRGGYSGFGAANTPVRLASQAATPWL